MPSRLKRNKAANTPKAMLNISARSGMLPAAVALLAGGLLALAFAPFDFWPLAILSPVLLLWSLHRAGSTFQILFRSWLFGAAYWLVGVHWLYFSVSEYGGVQWFFAALLTLLLTLSLGLLQTLTIGLWQLMRRSTNAISATDCMVLLPCCWGLVEWLKGWIFTGLPWLDLGTTTLGWWAGGLLPVIGSRGLSPLLLCVAGAIYLALFHRNKRHSLLAIFAGFALLLTGLAASQVAWTRPTGQQITARIVQTDLTAWQRWQAGGLALSVREANRLTVAGTGDEQLVLWPEVALPARDTTQGVPELLQQMQRYMAARNQTLALGILHQDKQGGVYNAIRLLGVDSGLYLKSRLVPFGEFYPALLQPLTKLLQFPASSLQQAPAPTELLRVGGIPFVTAICYEITYPELILPQAARSGLILTSSNDSWFGRSIGPWQHLQIAQVRAAETGRWVLRSANGGIGGAINEKGIVIRQLEPFAADATSISVPIFSGSTPASLLPLWLWPLLCTLIAAALGLWRRYFLRSDRGK